MNADLLMPGKNVSYLRGTTRERVHATIVGLLSFVECVTISYECSGRTQLYCDCPVERLTFPIVRAKSPTSERCPSQPPTATVRSGVVAADGFGIVLRLRASTLRRRMTPNIFKSHLSFHKPLGPPRPYLKKLCITSVSDASTKACGALSALRHPHI